MKIFISLMIIFLTLFPIISSMETINFSELSMEEKVGQLLFVKPIDLNKNYLEELHVGGIFLNSQKTKEEYRNYTSFYKNNSKIRLFIATDMEGYWNPFSWLVVWQRIWLAHDSLPVNRLIRRCTEYSDSSALSRCHTANTKACICKILQHSDFPILRIPVWLTADWRQAWC